mmetsp:Transcript_4330/g.7920  ORF Transcript_4330/g.7920 Transcript_4330/m.7920 type:complete len:533 (+) Transcript_4330:396-1994(+)
MSFREDSVSLSSVDATWAQTDANGATTGHPHGNAEGGDAHAQSQPQTQVASILDGAETSQMHLQSATLQTRNMNILSSNKHGLVRNEVGDGHAEPVSKKSKMLEASGLISASASGSTMTIPSPPSTFSSLTASFASSPAAGVTSGLELEVPTEPSQDPHPNAHASGQAKRKIINAITNADTSDMAIESASASISAAAIAALPLTSAVAQTETPSSSNPLPSFPSALTLSTNLPSPADSDDTMTNMSAEDTITAVGDKTNVNHATKKLQDSEQERMVSLLRREHNYMPSPQYLNEFQSELSYTNRQEIVGWMIDLAEACKVSSLTVSLATNVLDRFLSRRTISFDALRAIAAASFLIACKLHEQEQKVPCLKFLSWSAQVDRNSLEHAEALILAILRWDVNGVTAHQLVPLFLAADYPCRHLTEESEKVLNMLLDCCLIDMRFLDYSASICALACIGAMSDLSSAPGMDCVDGAAVQVLVHLRVIKRQTAEGAASGGGRAAEEDRKTELVAAVNVCKGWLVQRFQEIFASKPE